MTNPSHRDKRAPWIRDAMKAPAPALNTKRGLALVELPADDISVTAFPSLIVKDNCSRWPEREQATLSVKTVGLVA